MDKLIQTEKCSIIYGKYKRNNEIWPYQELFRCPRELDAKDLKRYVEENGCFLGFENDEATTDLQNVNGYEMQDYWRMYYRDGWEGRWMSTITGGRDENKVSLSSCKGVQEIVDWILDTYKHGCNCEMITDLKANYKSWGNDGKRFILKPIYNDLIRVMFDTTYGNGDYPVRIYVYKRKEN